MWDNDVSNKNNDLKAQYQYVSGNVNLKKKIENLERTHKQQRHTTYKRNLRARRNNWKKLESLANLAHKSSSCCNYNCKNIKEKVKPNVRISSESDQKKQSKSYAKKRIIQKESKMSYQANILQRKQNPS